MSGSQRLLFRPHLEVLEDRRLLSSGLTIIRNYIETGETFFFGVAGQAPMTNVTGSGDLVEIFNAAADWWEAAIQEDHTVTIDYGWIPIDAFFVAASTRLLTQGGVPHRITSAAIRFDNDGGAPWFVDPTPWLNEEFADYDETFADLGGGWVNTGRIFSGGSGDAGDRLDLFTLALHEIGHTLGLNSRNLAYQSETGPDNDIDVVDPLRHAGTVIPTTNSPGVFNPHLAMPTSLMAATFLPGDPEPNPGLGERWLISGVDILANAQISQFKNIKLDPKPDGLKAAQEAEGQLSASVNAQAAADHPTRLEFSDAFGPPFYTAATGPNFVGDGIFAVHDDEWAAIAFYRPPTSIPEDFNLLEGFDLGALDDPLTVDGFAVFKSASDPAPIVAHARGTGDVPIWFVSWPELLAAMADNVLTIGELSSLDSLLIGTATSYREQNHIFGVHPVSHLTIVAQATLEDGSSFSVQAVEVGLELQEVRIVFK